MVEIEDRPAKGGRYEHYKGGRYTVIGVGEHESLGHQFVVYTSDSEEHNEERATRGSDFVLRPLNHRDGPDPWNSSVDLRPDTPHPLGSEPELVLRFRKIEVT